MHRRRFTTIGNGHRSATTRLDTWILAVTPCEASKAIFFHGISIGLMKIRFYNVLNLFKYIYALIHLRFNSFIFICSNVSNSLFCFLIFPIAQVLFDFNHAHFARF